MISLNDKFPDTHRLIKVYLHDGTDFIGSYRHGGSGLTSITGDFTNHYYSDDEFEEKYQYSNILGWEYTQIID